MPMNSFTMKGGKYAAESADKEEESTATGFEITTTGSRHDEEVTEITVRIRKISPKDVGNGDFDIHKLRGEEVEIVDVHKLSKNYIDPKGRRFSPRYAKSLTTIIYTANQSFRTKTVNISVGGALLEHSLPSEFVYAPLEVLFIHEDESGQKQYFLFKAEAVTGHRENTRVQFKAAAQNAQDSLAALLERLGPGALVA